MSRGLAPPRRVLSNWLWLVGAQVVVRVVALGYKVFLARTLAPQGYGHYAWVLTTVVLFSIIVEAGFNRLLIRDIAREPARGPALLGVVTRIRGGLAAAALAAMLATFLVVPTDRAHLLGLAIVGLTLFLHAGGLTFDAAFYAVERASFSGTGQVIVTVAGAVLGVGALAAGLGLPGLFAGVVVAEGAHVAYLYLRLEQVALRPRRERVPWRPLVRDAWPYALLAVLGMVYFRVDTVMLGPLRGDAETGVYTAAYKLFEVLIFVPGTLAAVILPRMARYHGDDQVRLAASHVRLTRLLFAVAVPISTVLWVGSPAIVAVLFGADYAASVPVLRLLAVTFVFHCLHTANGAVVLSGRVLGPVVWLSLLTAGTNVALNAYFIPQYGAPAAAATTLASEVLSWGVFTVFIHWRIVRLTGWRAAVFRPAVAAAVAALPLVALRQWPVGALLVGGATYGAACAVVGVVRWEDVAMLRAGTPADGPPSGPVDLA